MNEAGDASQIMPVWHHSCAWTKTIWSQIARCKRCPRNLRYGCFIFKEAEVDMFWWFCFQPSLPWNYVFEMAFIITIRFRKGTIRRTSLIQNAWPKELLVSEPSARQHRHDRGAQIKERNRQEEDTATEAKGTIMSSPWPAAEMLRRPGVWEATFPSAGSMSHFSHSRWDLQLNSPPALSSLLSASFPLAGALGHGRTHRVLSLSQCALSTRCYAEPHAPPANINKAFLIVCTPCRPTAAPCWRQPSAAFKNDIFLCPDCRAEVEQVKHLLCDISKRF